VVSRLVKQQKPGLSHRLSVAVHQPEPDGQETILRVPERLLQAEKSRLSYAPLCRMARMEHPATNVSHLARRLFMITVCSVGCVGCYSHTVVGPDNAREYQDEAVTVETTRGTIYELRPSWEIDTLGNVSGRGSSVTVGRVPNSPEKRLQESSEPFVGTIPADSIATMRSSQFDAVGTATAVLVISVPVLLLVAWLAVPSGH